MTIPEFPHHHLGKEVPDYIPDHAAKHFIRHIVLEEIFRRYISSLIKDTSHLLRSWILLLSSAVSVNLSQA